MAQNFNEIIDTLEIRVGVAVNKIALDLDEFIRVARINGMSDVAIYEYILNDIQNSGRFFGAFKNSVAGATRNGIEEFANVSSMNHFQSQGYRQWRWISAGKSVCPDCEERHGLEGSMEFFNTIGLPKSGFSVCQGNCLCKLVAVDYQGENLEQPLKRNIGEGRKK